MAPAAALTKESTVSEAPGPAPLLFDPPCEDVAPAPPAASSASAVVPEAAPAAGTTGTEPPLEATQVEDDEDLPGDDLSLEARSPP